MRLLNLFSLSILVLSYQLYFSEAGKVCRKCIGEDRNMCCEEGVDPIDYILTIPNALTAGTNQQACVSIHRFDAEDSAVDITVHLHGTNDTNVYDSYKDVLGVGRLEVCFRLKVPKIDLPPGTKMKLAAITMELYILKTEYILTATKKLLIYPPDLDVYINTDKQVYKPGQTVLFRVLQLEGLYPSSHTIDFIAITDPKGRALMMYRDREPESGLVSDKFQLIAEPEEGTWHIELDMAGKEYKTSFEVKEYVLPKYEVTIEAPKYLHVEVESFSIKICGKYTYGKPVQGDLVAEISVISQWDWGSPRPRQTLRTKTDESGCALIEGSPEALEFRNNRFTFHDMRLKVHAEITENATGITVSGENSDCKLTTMPYVLRLENAKRYFKPGLPYKFQVYYADVSGVPIVGRYLVVNVTVKSDDERQPTSYTQTTDSQGKIFVSMDTEAAVDFYDFEIYDPSVPPLPTNWWMDNQELSIRRDSGFQRAYRKISLSYSYLKLDAIDEDQVICFQHVSITGRALMSYLDKQYMEDLNIYYRVVARDNIIEDGKATIGQDVECLWTEYPHSNVTALRYSCTSSFEFRIFVRDWMPEARVLVYTIRGQVVADDIPISAECFLNEANLEIDTASVRPGGNVGLTVSASPNSLCALSIVDKSVHLLGGDNTLTRDKVKSGLVDERRHAVVYVEDPCSQFEYQYSVDDDDYVTDDWDYNRRKKRDTSENGSDEEEEKRQRRSLIFHGTFGQNPFENARLQFITNVYIAQRECPPMANVDYFTQENVMFDVARSKNVGGPRIAKSDAIEVRNYFPETWKWELFKTGEDGVATFVEEMPDTITEWVATSYCLSSETGIGISNVGHVRGFKPIFLSMALPYSVIRGEEITIKSVLFNYMEKDICLEMAITLELSKDFELLTEGAETTYKCLCGGDVAPIQYDIRPLALGKITFTMKAWSRDGHICGKEVEAHPEATDGVERVLLVEPEGIEEEITTNDFLCIDDEKTHTATLHRPITVPENSYDGSARLLINVIGSIVGPVLDNLDSLVQMPFGCGEQNMVTMVPNIVVMKYLEAVGEADPGIEEVITENIRAGYQRQLKYQREDGSFSAFGERDNSGSTWLTAFVISTFNQAKDYIFVDDKVISRATNFIDLNRGPNGCVKKVGVVHNKAMMGGADGPNALNAYIELALYQPGNPTGPESPQDISGCDMAVDIKLYTRAIKFYTNGLKGKSNSAKLLWTGLKKEARLVDGTSFDNAEDVFWSDEEQKEETEDKIHWWYYRKPSDAVEVTGYVLLGYLELEKKYPEEFPISQAYPIVHWLTTQRNAHGGFSSTQNTVIGIKAISAYAARTFVPNTELNVAVLQEMNTLREFLLVEENALITNQIVIVPPPPSLSYAASGIGCALIQTNLRYNVPRKEVDPTFKVDVNVRGLENGCDSPGTRLLVVCATYAGTHAQPVSNMAVFEIKLVSGFKANEDSLRKMAKNNLENGLKRYEIDGKKVIVYFRAIGSLRKCAAFEVTYEEEVKNVQPGVVRVYDYYEPTKETSAFYTMSCVWENYIPKEFVYDCMTWGTAGVCSESCLSRSYREKKLCAVSQNIERAVDYCSIFKSACGETGDCRITSTYYRCSCHDGYKKARWGVSCIPEEEEEDDGIEEPPLLTLTTSPFCEEGKICPKPAIILPGGDTDEYFCIPGFDLVENGTNSYCDDVDECESESCDSDTHVCKNSAGSFSCECKDGFLPFRDADENIEEPSECVESDFKEVEDLPLFPDIPPLIPSVDSESVLLPEILPVAPDKLLTRCPKCLSSFPKVNKRRRLFCPKENVYVVTTTNSSTFNLRAIVLHGESTYGKLIRDVKLELDDECACETLQSPKSLMFTAHDLVEDGDGIKSLRVDDVATITPKRAWKKVQRYVCEDEVPPLKALSRGD